MQCKNGENEKDRRDEEEGNVGEDKPSVSAGSSAAAMEVDLLSPDKRPVLIRGA